MSASQYLPLTETALEVLLSLSTADKHGYSIIQEVSERTDGRLRMHAGTLYRALNRLLETGLICETAETGTADGSDARRRYYSLTTLGRDVARAELLRLSRQLSAARSARLISDKELA